MSSFGASAKASRKIIYMCVLIVPHCTLYLYDVCQKSTNKMRETDEIQATKWTKLMQIIISFNDERTLKYPWL